MYCVKCGVKLQEGTKECPLCLTPVMTDENIEAIHQKYSQKYPKDKTHERYAGLGVFTALLIACGLVCLIICLNLHHYISWSGFVITGILTFYFIFLFPYWFKKYYYFIFVPVNFLCIELLLLYICLATGGNWFMSFAFPLVLLIAFVTVGSYPLYHYIKGGRLFITGGLLIVIGLFSILVELFQTITFGTPMFTWSLYSVVTFGALGLFLIISGCIPNFKAFLERKFFF